MVVTEVTTEEQSRSDVKAYEDEKQLEHEGHCYPRFLGQKRPIYGILVAKVTTRRDFIERTVNLFNEGESLIL